MEIIRIIVGGMTNSYILCDEDKNAILIDPGAEAEKIIQIIEERDLQLEAILLTHSHGDHIGALNDVKEHFDVPICLLEEELDVYNNPEYNMAKYMGFSLPKYQPDLLLKDGDTIELKVGDIDVLWTPGHTIGSTCFLYKDILFSGDTLFEGSIGRTDFPTGDYSTMVNSLKKLAELDEEVTVLSGHGEETTIGKEKITNPFLLQIL